ncbi:hypothetical protein ES703_26471 [subsurface metagenome]
MTSDGPVFTSPAPSQPRPTQLPLHFTSEARRPTRFAQLPAAPSATLARLDRGALLVYVHLLLAGGARAFSQRGIWISTAQLVERTGLSKDTVRRARRQLRSEGLLRYHLGDGRRRTVYWLHTGEEERLGAQPYTAAAAEVLRMWKTPPPEGLGGRTAAPPGVAPMLPPKASVKGLERSTRVRQLTLFNNDELDDLHWAPPDASPDTKTAGQTRRSGTPPGGAPMHPLLRRDENAHPR